MPNYKFKCLKCGHEFQKLLPAAHEEQKCLECGHPTQKQLEAPGVQFKGSGFFKTDSKKENPKPSEKNDEK
jgi:putative FmdB family regulatory protein